MTDLLPGLRPIEGIYEHIPEDDYHADKIAPMPSLSSTMAHALIVKSPAHVLASSRRLNPHYKESKGSDAMDTGDLCHAVVAGDPSNLAILSFDDFRSGAARAARDAAIASGKTPILREKYDAAMDTVIPALRSQIAVTECHSAFREGNRKELTLVWYEEEFDIWCRARIDDVPPAEWLFDYKTTSGSAEPSDWIRNHLFSDGKDIQAAFYSRGWFKLTGEKRKFVFPVQEINKPPYAMSLIGVTDMQLYDANEKVAEAMEIWSWCLRENQFPGYAANVCWADTPIFAAKSWQFYKERKELAKADGTNLREMSINIQSPNLEDKKI